MNTADRIIAAARSVLGAPYVWGGESPAGFDCSGLVQWCYAQAGIHIPRVSQAQAQGGVYVPRNELAAADIIIYYPDASHVALYVGDGQVIEAATYGVPVQQVPIDNAGPYNQARRYLAGKDTVMTLFGPDVSNNNWADVSQMQSFMSQLAPEGFSWVEHKVSQGNYYQDPYWQPALAYCQSINFPIIGYHYVTTDDPASQAANFVANKGGTVAMLDFESGSGDIANFWAVVNAFNAAGVTITLSYIPHWYWQQIGSPDLSQVPGLIASSYFYSGDYASTMYNESGGDSGPGWQPYGGATPAIWQFTDAANIAGMLVDCNAFKGTTAQLINLLEGTVSQPAPPPPSGDYPAIPEPSTETNQVSQIWGQLLTRWSFLGHNTPVEALGAIGEALNIPGYTNPRKADQ